MLGRMFGFFWRFPQRLHWVWRIVNDPIRSKTYYPDEERKSKLRIVLENLAWALRKGKANTFYFAYGLDRKRGPAASEFLGIKEFYEYRKRASQSCDRLGLDYYCLLEDKLVFGKYLNGLGFPTPRILAICDGDDVAWLDTKQRLSLESFLDREIDGFCKERVGECGKGAFSLAVRDGTLYFSSEQGSVDELRRRITGAQFLVQERVAQHPALAALYPGSVNTIRLVTIMVGGEPQFFYSLLRIGNRGAECDNCAGGGIMVGIDRETGALQRHGYMVPPYGTRVTEHPITGLRLEGHKIPFHHDAVESALALHRYFGSIHSIGWDIAMTEKGPCFVEGNPRWGLALPQIVYGGLRERYMEAYHSRRPFSK